MPSLVEPVDVLVVYSDFSCPRCYLASQRAAELARRGVEVDWRAIQHGSRVSVTGTRRDAEAQSVATDALEDARKLLRDGEHLPAAVSPMAPTTKAAISAYAEGRVARAGEEVRRLLFEAYWADGLDIGNPDVLRTVLGGTLMRSESTSDPVRAWGFAVDVSTGPVTTAAWRLIRDWSRAWQMLGRPELPCVWDGTRLTSGDRALQRLAEEVGRTSVAGATGEGPGIGSGVGGGWQPPTTVHPPAGWVSQVGDPWARALRMSR